MRLIRLAAIAAAVLVAVSAAFVWSFNSFGAERSHFSVQAWKQKRIDAYASNDPGCVLGGLAEDIIRKGLMNNQPKPTVVAQLGEPDEEHAALIVYAVGQCHGWGWHQSELVLRLSAGGTVSEAELRRTPMRSSHTHTPAGQQ